PAGALAARSPPARLFSAGLLSTASLLDVPIRINTAMGGLSAGASGRSATGCHRFDEGFAFQRGEIALPNSLVQTRTHRSDANPSFKRGAAKHHRPTTRARATPAGS